ncbi:MAG: DUF1329 domain-containing protein [Deltaproteobacteria bacterium]|nr:DUF1329 domain-containing protein [Deltaproteobacteria bacterium]
MRSNQQVIKKVMALVCTLIVMGAVQAGAGEITFPLSAYTPEELQKVRAWEKTWAGKKIDKSNIDQVAEFMLDSFVGIYKDPQKWNAPPEGNYFQIVPYKQISPTPGEIESTNKYAPLVKTDAEGNVTNYADIAGTPFPQPKNGYEVAYNVDCNSKGDDDHNRQKSPNINPRTKTDRLSDQEYWNLSYIHRNDVEPRPALLKNKDGIQNAQFMHMHMPPEMLNTRMITYRYFDPAKEDLQYLYYAQYRRIRRMSTSERENAIDGTDMIYDDANQWDGHVSRNTYNLKGNKELLCARNQDMSQLKRRTGQAIADNWSLERCNLYQVEVKSKNPDYIYSKRMWYVDPETNYIAWQETWDQLGRYWKGFMLATQELKTVQGHTKALHVGHIQQDFQRTHSGHSVINHKEIGKKISTKMYSLSSLQKTY